MTCLYTRSQEERLSQKAFEALEPLLSLHLLTLKESTMIKPITSISISPPCLDSPIKLMLLEQSSSLPAMLEAHALGSMLLTEDTAPHLRWRAAARAIHGNNSMLYHKIQASELPQYTAHLKECFDLSTIKVLHLIPLKAYFDYIKAVPLIAYYQSLHPILTQALKAYTQAKQEPDFSLLTPPGAPAKSHPVRLDLLLELCSLEDLPLPIPWLQDDKGLRWINRASAFLIIDVSPEAPIALTLYLKDYKTPFTSETSKGLELISSATSAPHSQLTSLGAHLELLSQGGVYDGARSAGGLELQPHPQSTPVSHFRGKPMRPPALKYKSTPQLKKALVEHDYYAFKDIICEAFRSYPQGSLTDTQKESVYKSLRGMAQSIGSKLPEQTSYNPDRIWIDAPQRANRRETWYRSDIAQEMLLILEKLKTDQQTRERYH